MHRPTVPSSGRPTRRPIRVASRRLALPRPLLAALALVALAAGLATGALGPASTLGQVAATSTPTPISLRLATVTGATATPTPRVVILVRPTPTPTSVQTAPATATATATPRPTSTPTPSPTATPRPTATPPPTSTTAPRSASRVSFTAEDWVGGYYRGDGLYYGRPWVAVYGARSKYPRAALTFDLDAAPSGPATLTITGLDDELPALNEIALEVNGQRVLTGPSPFVNWDGVGNGADAAWTSVAFTLPANLLRAGSNEIAIANLTRSANFGLPPYVLLAGTTLRVPGAKVTTPAAAAVAAGREAETS